MSNGMPQAPFTIWREINGKTEYFAHYGPPVWTRHPDEAAGFISREDAQATIVQFGEIDGITDPMGTDDNRLELPDMPKDQNAPD